MRKEDNVMSKKIITDALEVFDEKYFSVRYPAQSITVFGML
jgi:hypothetical protein